MGIVSDSMKLSEDPAIKNFLRDFPDVAEPLGNILDDLARKQVRAIESRIAPLEKSVSDFQKKLTLPDGLAQVTGASVEAVPRSFIQKFAQDVATGKYRGREKEVEAIQAKIDAAVSAGKILNQ